VKKHFFRSVFASKAIITIVLVITIIAPSWYWWARIESVRDKNEVCETVPLIPEDRIETATDSMKEQSALLLNWAFVALGAIIALLTTTRTHRFTHIRMLFLILAPALSLLTGSLWAGVLFQRRLTYLQLNGCTERQTLMDLLLAQSNLLNTAICVLATFSFLCLLQILKGSVDPRQGDD
jgi:hypothetical protein